VQPIYEEDIDTSIDINTVNNVVVGANDRQSFKNQSRPVVTEIGGRG
jgi:hypothetical protein